MRQVPLTQGLFALVDDEDYSDLVQHKWYAMLTNNGHWRAATRIGGKLVYMPRYILGVTDAKVNVDHRNGDALDNQRHNLRTGTNKQNQENRQGANTNSSTGVRGVTRRGGKYRAYVHHNYTRHDLGTFDTLEEADAAAQAGRKRLFTHA